MNEVRSTVMHSMQDMLTDFGWKRTRSRDKNSETREPDAVTSKGRRLGSIFNFCKDLFISNNFA